MSNQPEKQVITIESLNEEELMRLLLNVRIPNDLLRIIFGYAYYPFLKNLEHCLNLVFGNNKQQIHYKLAIKTIEEHLNQWEKAFVNPSEKQILLVLLGMLYWERGDRDPEHKDVHHAMELWQQSSDFRSFYYLGRVYQKRQQESEANSCFVKAIDGLQKETDAWSICLYGYLLKQGWGVEKNARKAVEYYRKSAELGSAHGQFNLGICYKFGDGVKTDLKETLKYYRLAAEQGNPLAQGQLGLFYRSGEIVKVDFNQARFWLQKAADQDDSQSEEVLQWMAYE